MANQDPHLSYRELAEQLLLPYSKKINPTIKQYRDILNKGLPGKASEKKKIIVVGAGIAGMLAAKLLSDYGHEVSIIEANDNRVGGRIKTFGEPGRKSPFRDKEQYAEAGAMRFPLDLHPLLKAYIAKYKLETQEFYIADVDPNHPRRKRFNAWLRCNSFQQRRREYNKNPAATNERFTEGASVPSPTETAGDLLDAALDKARDYFSYVNDKGKRVNKPYEEWIEGWAKIIEDFDEYTLLRYLREEAGLDQRTIDLIGTIENLTSRLPLSFIHSFLGRSDINTSNVYSELVGGSWHLTEAIYQDIKADFDVKLNRRMTLIDFCREDGVCGRHAGPTKPLSIWTVDENEQPAGTYSADLAIITIPFSSLRFVRSDPDFSYGKRRAVIELHYDAATKVLLEFTQRWWEWDRTRWETELKKLRKANVIKSDKKLQQYLAELDTHPPTNAFGGGSITDNPNRFLYYPSHPVPGSDGGVILASYTWADDARRWDSMDDKARYKFALRGLRVIHGNRIWLYCARGATQSWARSPYAFGEAAVFSAGQLTNLHPHIPTPEGPIHFAGEHTSLKHAWVEGSLESAIRVALEIKDVTDSSHP